jgi:hypothetical protein
LFIIRNSKGETIASVDEEYKLEPYLYLVREGNVLHAIYAKLVYKHPDFRLDLYKTPDGKYYLSMPLRSDGTLLECDSYEDAYNRIKEIERNLKEKIIRDMLENNKEQLLNLLRTSPLINCYEQKK